MEKHKIAIVILAAGASTRLGTPKQLIPWKGQTLLRYICEVALQSKADRVSVVLGSQAALIKSGIGDMKLEIVENGNWHQGISSSIQAGMEALPGSMDAALMLSCDQPEITPVLLNQIIETYVSKRNKIVACRYGAAVGIPALFDRSIFPALHALKGDTGAKSILLDRKDRVTTVDFPLGVYDIDTQDDLNGMIHKPVSS